MDWQLQIASAIVGIFGLAVVAVSLRNARLYPSYAALWFGIGAFFVALPFLSGVLRQVAEFFGIIGVNHLIYASLFCFLLIYIFYLTRKVCELTHRVERLIVSLAILEQGIARPPSEQ